MLAWATLPVALSAMLRDLDPLTLTWFRFLAASVVLATVLGSRGSLPKLSALAPTGWLLLVLATLFLAANYLLFLIGLSLTTPANTQILMQLSPLLFALGGITIFGERFERRQWLGFFILIGGLAVFCSDQLLAFVAEGERYLLGYAVILAAAFSWAVSLLIQKRLLTIFRSQALLLCIYVGCALCFTPLADPGRIAALSGGAILLLLYCALNTVVAYGAFSAALENVEASRAGAVIALSPVATFGFIAITHALFPGALPPEQFSPWMLFGAATVVIGSVITARG
jgi:drug/metabolite transporter (DMT)-like permease